MLQKVSLMLQQEPHVSKSKQCILDQNSGARATLDLIADKWTVLVLYALLEGTRRFGERKFCQCFEVKFCR